ncbi:MAG TPA: serine hydrolase domain-containing protein [Flavipsychrobacter sp.]|nr:serine hydrolase domain-containing protein [Flavipsychrobacter sp.]
MTTIFVAYRICEMLSSSRSYIAFSVFSVLLVACQPKTEKVNATPRFHDVPGKTAIMPLAYQDTTLPQYERMIERLDSFYKVQVRGGFNGSVLIGHEGKIVYERYFGHARKEGSVPLQSNSSTQLASISKTFTGAATLYLHQHNYLNINDPVSNYLSGFPYKDITVKMLLNHRSGLPDYQKWDKRYVPNANAPMSNAQMLNILVRHKPALESRPDTRFKYCNTNYALLANIIEKVTEMKYEDFMQRYMFEPLGMNNTFVYRSPQTLPANASGNYKYNWVRWDNNFADGVVGDKGIYSTVQDMYRWDQSFYEGKLLTNETIELSYGPCSFEKPGVKNYGLGWRLLCYPSGNKVIYHNGWWHGSNTVFYRFIKDNLTFIVLGNRYNTGIYRQAKVLYSIVKNVPVGSDFDDEG